MTSVDVKGELLSYLQGARETLVRKLDGLGEFDIRRPLTPTGTNLLGLVKHSTRTHLRYFGEVFDRTCDTVPPWSSADAEPNADLWAAPDETRDDIVAGYQRAWAFADATIHELVHVTAETQRHAGHADILREFIDGSAGLLKGHDNLRIGDPEGWRAFHDRIEAAARQFPDTASGGAS